MLRFEYKYYVPTHMLDKLRDMIAPFMEADIHASEASHEYTVRSIYFDTPQMECYHMKMAGVKRRNKVRLRGYNVESEGNPVFFELKKKVDDPLYKNRAGLDYDTAKRILRGEPIEDFQFLGGKNGSAVDNVRRFMYHIHARQMCPVVTVVYEREPYQSALKDEVNDLRITFDKNLRAVPNPDPEDLFNDTHAQLIDGGHFILEVKFNNYLPSWVKVIVASLGLVKEPASKYALCIDKIKLAKSE